MHTPSLTAFVVLVSLCSLCFPLDAQESETLLDSAASIGSMWSLGIKANSVQKEIGTLFSIYWGTVIDRTFIFGFGGVFNLSHKVTNYGAFQLLAQYVPEPDKLLHFGGQLMVGFASAKDYESPKTGLFDNFANTTGANFYLIEPRVNAELNITRSKKFVLGLGYCAAFGLDERNISIARSGVTNEDLSGLSITLALKFGEY